MLAGQRSPTVRMSGIPPLPAPPLSSSLSSTGLPTNPSSGFVTPKEDLPVFPIEQLRPLIRRMLNRQLSGAIWAKEGDRSKVLCKEMAEEIRRCMTELASTGYKHIVSCQIAERSQGGHAHLSALWDPSTDVFITEQFTNDTIVCTVLAVAVRY